MTYLTNQLNEYDTYTYNLSLFMIRPDSVPFLEQNITSGNAVMIADNAREARYNINELEQSYVVGHNRVRSTFANQFDIKIAEPNGVTLLDTIRKAADQLGIINHVNAVYIIRIEFNGRLPNGAIRKHPQVFHYPVTIREFQFRVDNGGTNYSITAVENSTNAYSYLNNVIFEQITILATTVGDFFEKFNIELNNSTSEAIEFSTDQLYPDNISVEFDSAISNWEQWEFQALTEEETQNNVNIISVGQGGERQLQITVNNGTNLTDLVNVILGLTAEYKNIVLRGNGQEFARTAPHEDVTSHLDQLPVFHKVTANLEYGDYDILRGEYVKTITYRVVPYVIVDEIISPSAYITSINDSNIQNRRVANIRRGGFLRKRYDYIYTGKNTEVLDFDMTFNRAYYYVTPFGGGQLGDPNRITPVQAQANDASISSRTIPQMLETVIEDRSRLFSLNQQRARANALPSGIGGRVINSIIGGLETNINTATTTFRNSVSNFGAELTNRGFNPRDIAAHLRFAQDVISDDEAPTSDNDNRGGYLRFGALQANIDNAADMLQIELHVRGDPYWLGTPSRFSESSFNDGDDLADFERGTTGFFLNINLPPPNEDGQGRRKPDPDYEVSGFYIVRDVISRYRNGQFTMHLNAVRDLGTNTPTAINALESDSSTPTTGNNTLGQVSIDLAQLLENARIGPQ